MTSTKELNVNTVIKEIYNGTIQALKTVVPIEAQIGSPNLVEPPLEVKFGVLIGFTGDIKGELIIKGDDKLFSSIGEAMFGMALSDEMLESFSGELGNMLAGSLSTQIAQNNITTDITHPTVLTGNAKLSGFKRALVVKATYPNIGDLDVCLLIKQ
ncbi:chemotaxis protein CheX [Aquibacillus kalidii]|uniref:chemotaxis protein CheX n=1 Tax=Aquibacillus kalidii TaxID=2762597 RepID=UPI001647E700|nr:chemotaxis protein CheX [Aquibacillus kalidii]